MQGREGGMGSVTSFVGFLLLGVVLGLGVCPRTCRCSDSSGGGDVSGVYIVTLKQAAGVHGYQGMKFDNGVMHRGCGSSSSHGNKTR